MENSSKDQPFSLLPEHTDLPPTPTPTPHHFHRHTTLGSLTSYGSQRRNCSDTPLSLYASSRARLRKELEAYTSFPTTRRRDIHQVPLSALCSTQTVLGKVGNPFNSTTRFKSLPLPTVYNRHQLSSRGIRNVSLHTDRYVPATSTRRRWTVSDSLLNLSDLCTRQKEHLLGSETGINYSRQLQRSREVTPHRVEQSYYMNGHTAQLFDREEITQDELEALQKLALSQNKQLYHGKGVRFSGHGGRTTSEAIKKFEVRLEESIRAQAFRNYELGDVDTSRYSRAASRTMTPGSPIIEEDEEVALDQKPQRTSSDRSFITQQNS